MHNGDFPEKAKFRLKPAVTFFIFSLMRICFTLSLFVCALFVACLDATSSSEPLEHRIAEGCAFSRYGRDLYEMMMYRGEDSMTVSCDTFFVVDSFLVYDTVYKDTFVNRYVSFVYGKRNDSLFDTLTARVSDSTSKDDFCTSRVSCSLDSMRKEFFCSTPMREVCVVPSYYEFQSSQTVVDGRVNFAQCGRRNVLCIKDTFYVDSVVYGTYKMKDTTYLNYGKHAWTNYIPWTNAPYFDTVAFRAALDTLDTRHPSFAMDTLETGYYISMDGLPEWVSRGKIQVDGSPVYYQAALICGGTCYPSDYVKAPFFLANGLEKPLEKDTIVTWVLHYNYLGTSFEGDMDSIKIVTLFKSGK